MDHFVSKISICLLNREKKEREIVPLKFAMHYGKTKSHNRTERDTQGVGRDILIPKKLFLELCGPRGNSFR